MAKTFNVTFDINPGWPVRIAISDNNGAPATFHIKLVDAQDLADLLENPSLSGDSLTFVSSGGVNRYAYWKSLDNFMLVTNASRTSMTANEANAFARALRDVIPNSSTSVPEAVVAPDEDTLAGAKKRMDDNLREMFA